MHSSILKKFKCDSISPITKVGLFGKGIFSLGLMMGLFFSSLGQNAGEAPQEKDKTRILVLTDIENEPDDAQSMVRFLTYSNQWTVEGLIATTSIHQRQQLAPGRIHAIVDAYGQVRDNLLLHEKGYPEVSYLKEMIKEGYPDYGLQAVGEGKDSEGSEWLINRVDSDSKPLWVLVWGGPNCLAQALWKVRMTRTSKELEEFVSKLRVYTISDQDDSGPWLRKNFPDLFYIVSPGTHDRYAYHYATWTGISGDYFHGRFSGADFSLVDNPWLLENIRSKGPLGAQYPETKFLMEGDSPSFLYLIENGLGSPENPDFGSWGGRYECYTPRLRKHFYGPESRPIWTNAEDEVLGVDGRYQTGNKATIWRWRAAYQNDFSARMDWTIKSHEEANHPPVPLLAHPKELKVKSGEKVVLNAKGSSDPDGDPLSYEWISYREAGTYAFKTLVEIEDKNQEEANFMAPPVTKPETVHIILAVTDKGIPSLTRYQRVIVNVFPE